MKEVRAGRKPYPTDLTDSQWEEIEPLYSGMRNRKWSKRELTNAVLYIVKTGCQWHQLPHDFPPYQTVYSFFSRGTKSGLWEKILAHLVEKTRKDAGKSAEPHYALIDSQSVKTVADNEKRGIDGGKKAKGRKRHAVIDTMGNLLGIVVHAANIHDTKSGILAAQKACKKYPSIQAFCADAGYRGTFIAEVQQQLQRRVDISEKIKPHEWVKLPWRWIVERTFGWMNAARRLAKEFEILVSIEEAMIRIAGAAVLLHRL